MLHLRRFLGAVTGLPEPAPLASETEQSIVAVRLVFLPHAWPNAAALHAQPVPRQYRSRLCGAFLLISDHPSYRAVEIDAEASVTFRIVGSVVARSGGVRSYVSTSRLTETIAMPRGNSLLVTSGLAREFRPDMWPAALPLARRRDHHAAVAATELRYIFPAGV